MGFIKKTYTIKLHIVTLEEVLYKAREGNGVQKSFNMPGILYQWRLISCY